jgi:hypothetical protein
MPAFFYLLILIAIAAALFAMAYGMGKERAAGVMRKRFARAALLENEAESLLGAYGYKVLGKQEAASYSFLLDGEEVAASIRPDYVVEKNGLVYAAEVKTGAKATQAAYPATRRQLLEYQLFYRCNGVLLVDMERRTIESVSFDVCKSASYNRGLRFFASGFAAGLLLAAAICLYFSLR